METHRIDFEKLPWQNPLPGMRFKAVIAEGKKLRLVEFSEELVEKDWCLRMHVGFILEGRMTIDFQGNVVEYRKGDGLFISEGEKHKAQVAKGERVLVIMFEKP